MTVWMRYSAQALAAALSKAQYRTLADQAHNVAPAVLAPVLQGFFSI